MRKITNLAGILFLQFLLTTTSALADEFRELMSSFHAGDFKTSTASLEEYVKQHPKHAESRFFLAKSYMGLNQSSLAEEQLRCCMELAIPGSDLQTNCISALQEISQSKSSGKDSTPGNQRNIGAPSQSSTVMSSQHAGTVQQLGSLRRLPNKTRPQGNGLEKNSETRSSATPGTRSSATARTRSSAAHGTPSEPSLEKIPGTAPGSTSSSALEVGSGAKLNTKTKPATTKNQQ